MLLLLRTNDQINIFLALLTMLIFSDGRAQMFQFAVDAKVAIVLLVFLNIVFKWKDYRVFPNPIFNYMIPFFVFAVLATFWSVAPFVAFQKSVSYALIFFIVPLLISRAIHEEIELGKEFLAYAVVLFGAGLVVNFVSPDFTSLVGRYRGFFGNPNGLGIFLVVSFTCAYLLWVTYKDDVKFGKLPYLFLLFFGLSLIYSGSRTALFSVVIFFIFLRLRYFTNFATIAGFLVLILGYEYFFMRLPEIITALGVGDYLRIETLKEGSGRNVAWAFAWDQIQNVFYAGGGFGYTEHVFYRHGIELSRLGHQGNAHSSYLTLWLDTGLIGIVLYVFGFIRITLKGIRESTYTLPVVFAVAFSTYFESWLAASLNPFTSVFLMALTVLVVEAPSSAKNDGDEGVEDSENSSNTELSGIAARLPT